MNSRISHPHLTEQNTPFLQLSQLYKFYPPPQPTIPLPRLILLWVRRLSSVGRKVRLAQSCAFSKQCYLQGPYSSFPVPLGLTHNAGKALDPAEGELMRRLTGCLAGDSLRTEQPTPFGVVTHYVSRVCWFPEDFFCLIQSFYAFH